MKQTLFVVIFLYLELSSEACSRKRKFSRLQVSPDVLPQRGTDCECVPLHTCPLFERVLQGPRPLSNEQLGALRKATCDPVGNPKDPNVKCCDKYLEEIELNENGINTVSTIATSSSLADFENYCGQCEPSLDPRIVGGSEARPGQFPWIARLGYTDEPGMSIDDASFNCAGSLINHEYIITAAHCIERPSHLSQLEWVTLGDFDDRTDPDCTPDTGCAPPTQKFKVAWMAAHPHYRPNSYKNDIGVIKLASPANFSSWVHPVCLPKDPSTNLTGSRAVVSGWGRVASGEGPPKYKPTLQYLWKRVVSDDKCTQQYRDVVSRGQICAGGKKGEDSCEGDSGGPLARPESNGGDGFYTLIGIVSFGAKECGSGTLPGVYTKVTHYLEWISAVTSGKWKPKGKTRSWE